jgi:transposase-like protein
MVIHVLSCRFCQSQNIIKHGRDKNDRQRFRCRDCQRTFREAPGSAAHSEAFKARVLAAYQERCSMRGISRIFGISRITLANWLKKSQSSTETGTDTASRPGE